MYKQAGTMAQRNESSEREGSQKVLHRSTVSSRLEHGEERYQAFVHNSHEGIWCFELTDPIAITLSPAQQIKQIFKYAYLTEANEAMAAMYGAPSTSELIGKYLHELMVVTDERNIAYLKAFVKSGYRLSGVDSYEKDEHGNDKVFRNSLVGVVRDGMLLRAWGTQQDITEQYHAETALRKSEERLALALEASHMGMWEWKPQEDVLIWSDQMRRLWDMESTEEITYKKYISLIHPADRKKTQDVIRAAIKEGSQYRVEHRVIWRDGSVHWLLGQGKAYMENGTTVRMAGTTMNIDDRKKTEIELHESEQRFRSMADNAPVFIWVAGTDRRCIYLNRSWLDFTGQTGSQDLENGWLEGIHQRDAERCSRIYAGAFEARKPFTMDYRLRRHDGAYRWVMTNGSPRFSPEGKFLGYIGSCIDIEDLKRAERLKAVNAALRDQRSQLVALNRSKDEFISLASHQLRTPATGVKQYVGMLLEGYAGRLTKKQKELLQIAFESNERQMAIIDDLLRVAQVDAGKVVLHKERADIVRLVQDVLKEQASRFEGRNQEIKFTTQAPSMIALIDAKRMRMVFENLIDNASKYTPHGKKLMITITHNYNEIFVAIKDQGVGIAKNDIPKLFQKFSRVDNPLSTVVGGTGIGLYWAKRIVDIHEGAITVSSRLNQGSVFTVTLPKGLISL
jgi:PAS domain S-box-containing protein